MTFCILALTKLSVNFSYSIFNLFREKSDALVYASTRSFNEILGSLNSLTAYKIIFFLNSLEMFFIIFLLLFLSLISSDIVFI